MSFLIRALVWIMAMVIFSGCGLPKRQSPVFNAMGYYPPRTVSIGKELGGLEKYFAPNAATSFPRDELVYGRKRAIDLIYVEYTQRLSRRKTVFDVGMDFAKLGLTGAIPLVPITDTKSILGGISAGLMGAQGSINSRLFFEKTMPLLQAKMDTDRRAVWTRIQEGLKKPATGSDGSNVYTTMQALSDLEDYYLAGSLAGALMDIASAANQQQQQQQIQQQQQQQIQQQQQQIQGQQQQIQQQLLQHK